MQNFQGRWIQSKIVHSFKNFHTNTQIINRNLPIEQLLYPTTHQLLSTTKMNYNYPLVTSAVCLSRVKSRGRVLTGSSTPTSMLSSWSLSDSSFGHALVCGLTDRSIGWSWSGAGAAIVGAPFSHTSLQADGSPMPCRGGNHLGTTLLGDTEGSDAGDTEAAWLSDDAFLLAMHSVSLAGDDGSFLNELAEK